MSGATSCREIRHALGVYVLGAIDPADRAQVDEHLATCSDCREELAGLAGLPALLRRVPQAEAERLAEIDPAEPPVEKAPDELLPPVLARMAEARRVRRWRALAAAAAVVVLALGAGAAGATLLQSSSATPQSSAQVAGHWQTVSTTDATTGAKLTVKYTPKPWGTLMSVRVAGIPVGTVCNFQVTGTNGHAWVVGSWRVNYQGWYPASTALADANLHSFEVTSGGKVLASVNAA